MSEPDFDLVKAVLKHLGWGKYELAVYDQKKARQRAENERARRLQRIHLVTGELNAGPHDSILNAP